MTYKKISVLVPTRQRLNFLEKMIESFNDTVDNPEQAEIIFRCDSDDRETIEYLCKILQKTIIGPRGEGYKSLPAFYNDMARIAKGDLLMCCNDDVIFKTKGWPAILIEEANKYPDGIFNFGVNVGLNDDKFPFSIVSRKLVDILGFLNDERLLFSDVFLLDVMKYFNRAIRVNSVTIFHDWAGHGADETRKDANKHEFDIVFKDSSGNWTDTYRALHDSVVMEALEKIKRQDNMLPDLIINSFWNNKIHYSKKEIKELLKIIYKENIYEGEIILSNHKDAWPNILWGNVFNKVISVNQNSSSHAHVIDGRQMIVFGSLGDTKFLYKVIGYLSNLRAIIFDELYYSHIISPYFLFKKLIKPTGIIIFMNSGNKIPDHFGVHRFLNDLSTGYLDNRKHDIVRLNPDSNGNGVSYELIK